MTINNSFTLNSNILNSVPRSGGRLFLCSINTLVGYLQNNSAMAIAEAAAVLAIRIGQSVHDKIALRQIGATSLLVNLLNHSDVAIKTNVSVILLLLVSGDEEDEINRQAIIDLNGVHTLVQRLTDDDHITRGLACLTLYGLIYRKPERLMLVMEQLFNAAAVRASLHAMQSHHVLEDVEASAKFLLQAYDQMIQAGSSTEIIYITTCNLVKNPAFMATMFLALACAAFLINQVCNLYRLLPEDASTFPNSISRMNMFNVSAAPETCVNKQFRLF